MKKIKNLCVITNLFPPFPFVTSGMFLYNLVTRFVENGINCVVIRPVSLSKVLLKKKDLPPLLEKISIGESLITIYSPRFVSFGSKYRLFAELGYRIKEYVVIRQYQRIGGQIDALYAHFYTSGRTAKAIHDKFDVPFFTAHGESQFIEQFKDYQIRDVMEFYRASSGIIAVSSHIKRFIVEKFGMDKAQILVAPNGIDTNLFKQMDKSVAREKLKIGKDTTMVVSVGSLIKRKGPGRIVEAIQSLSGVHAYFIGKPGNDVPESTEFIHVLGEKSQKEIVMYLSAADMFVLPTLAEGSCNAIIEALACGLPVISSKRDFNEDILDESCALLIDPLSIDELRAAIVELRDNTSIRFTKAKGALERARNLSLSERANRIESFMEAQF